VSAFFASVDQGCRENNNIRHRVWRFFPILTFLVPHSQSIMAGTSRKMSRAKKGWGTCGLVTHAELPKNKVTHSESEISHTTICEIHILQYAACL